MTRFDDRRSELLADATNPVSQALLEKMPRMVAHPIPRQHIEHPGLGMPGVCAQDFDMGGAIGCTPREGFILNKAATLARPKTMLEIGSYVGWSSAHLLYGNRSRLVCVDSLNEEAGRIAVNPDVNVARRFHQHMFALGMADRVILVPDESPRCLSGISPESGWDFAFVDGWHFDGQPLRDVDGLLPLMNEAGVIFLHDMGLNDVNEAGKHLVANGWTFTGFFTPNFLAAFYKTEPKWWSKFIEGIGE